MKEFSVTFHLEDSGYFTALRLVAGAVCSLGDYDVDSIEDFKVCVTESALLLKNGGYDSAVCTFTGGVDGVKCEIEGKGGTPTEGDNEFSLALISALVKECEIMRRGAVIGKVVLKL